MRVTAGSRLGESVRIQGRPQAATRCGSRKNQKNVISLLDRLDTMDESARVANDQILMLLTSACVLQDRFKLAA
jgi:hypothetical protein